MMRTDVIIVGAGPAGLAAAEFLSHYAIDIVIVDEQAQPGGQIYRQPPEKFRVKNWQTSSIHKAGKRLLKRVSQIKELNWLTHSTVLGITQTKNTDAKYLHNVTICNQAGTNDIQTKCVLIAPGCYDVPVVFPGWTLPGVMATGGIQAFVKSQQIIPGERFLFVGTHPLQLVVADQISQSGGEVAAVIFAQPPSRVFAPLHYPATLLRQAAKFSYIAAILLRLSKAGVPVEFNHTVVKANGRESMESADIAPIDRSGIIERGAVRKVDCDTLGLCFGFIASSELARQCGAAFTWSASDGGWIIKHDPWMRTDIPGIYVAGEITGIAGAEIAMGEGKLAGMGIALDLGELNGDKASRLSKAERINLRQLGHFAEMLKRLSYPGKRLLTQLATDDSILCKCEEITVGEFRARLEKNPQIRNGNAAKLLIRTGMGLCQGRYCNYQITQFLAAHTSMSENDVGPFTARFPVKPLSIGKLIS